MNDICLYCNQLLNKKYQQMQSALNDKENQVPKIALDFKKKVISKPNSERTSSNSSLLKSPNSKLVSSNTISLIQKKRQYSQSLRQKNSQRQAKKSTNSETIQDKIKNQIQKFQSDALQISELNTLNNHTEQNSTITQKEWSEPKQNKKSTLFHSSFKKEQKSKLRDTKRQKNKLHRASMLIEGIRNLGFNQNFSMISISQNCSQQNPINQEFSVIDKINELSRIETKTQICSRQVDLCFGPFKTEETKEIELIKKQNNTFKKELAHFRKENASLKRQTQEIQKQLGVYKERNEYLQKQSTQQFKLLQSLQRKVNQPVKLPEIEMKLDQKLGSTLNDQNEEKLKQIISNYENQLFQATNMNKKLQFKNYILEKKLMDEGEIHKKQMARQISVWKQRYIKARNQNLRLKDSRSQMLFQMSISQQL